jgi:SAM-dependent methyltransferase
MADSTYSMQLGDADAERLELLGQFYDPASSAFLEAAGISAGDRVADLGCGHGGVTDRIAARVGDAGDVYAVDSSPDQLRVARAKLAHCRNVTFVQAHLEDDPLQGRRVDWVYCRFLLMHVKNLGVALSAMADMLTEEGVLLLEIADVGSLAFSPADPDSDLWRPWWYALGRKRGLSFDVADRITDALRDANFVIERRDRHRPIASSKQAKLVHALGFAQCANAYRREIGALPEQIETHRRYLDRVVHDPSVTVALFRNTQYIARRPSGSLRSVTVEQSVGPVFRRASKV